MARIGTFQLRFALRHPLGSLIRVVGGRQRFYRWDQRRLERFFSANVISTSKRVFYELPVDNSPSLPNAVADICQEIATEEDSNWPARADSLRAISSFSASYAWIVFAILKSLGLASQVRMVETGVRDGVSTTAILAALRQTKGGSLVSIDVCDSARIGRLVPPHLRSGWRLVRDDARRSLPGILSQCNPLDVFFHDSLHTEEQMLFEFRAASQCVRPGGFVIADNIEMNPAFWEFFGKDQRWTAKSIQYTPEHELGIARRREVS